MGFPSACYECVLLSLVLKKLLWLIAGQNIARLKKIYRESRQSQGDSMELPKKTDARKLQVNHEPCGNSQNNRNGLI